MTRMRFAIIVLLVLALPVQAQPPAKPKDALEASVDRALAFLGNLQEPDGAWLAQREKSPAVTALALMAFLSAGHVPGEGPHADVLDKGLRWILKQQHESGLFGAGTGLDMYHHGICTLLLAEVCGMTDRSLAKDVRPALAKAVRLILQAQRTAAGSYRGGWRYRPDSTDADTSITGWQLLALRAARNVGCDVPAERIELAIRFVLRCRETRSGAFCYQPGARPTRACTGTGILALELCGGKVHEHGHEALLAGGYLLKNPPRWNEEHFFYTAYYCAQAMFQLGGNYWDFYRPRLHAVLQDYQQPGGGWIGNEAIGPTYCTALAVLALTVEYRLLPIYQRDEAAERK